MNLYTHVMTNMLLIIIIISIYLYYIYLRIFNYHYLIITGNFLLFNNYYFNTCDENTIL